MSFSTGKHFKTSGSRTYVSLCSHLNICSPFPCSKESRRASCAIPEYIMQWSLLFPLRLTTFHMRTGISHVRSLQSPWWWYCLSSLSSEQRISSTVRELLVRGRCYISQRVILRRSRSLEQSRSCFWGHKATSDTILKKGHRPPLASGVRSTPCEVKCT